MNQELENYLRGTHDTHLSPPDVFPGLLQRLEAISALLAQAGKIDKMPALVQRAPNGAVSVHAIGERLTVGRKSPCQLVIDDPTLGRSHFQISCSPDESLVEDLQSTNGTWVNSERISRRVLRNGDIIEAGGQLFLFLKQ